MIYKLTLRDPESGVEILSEHPSVWQCVKDWELLALADRTRDYRVEDEDDTDVWVSVIRRQP